MSAEPSIQALTLEPQAERRRSQLVRAAALVIESEGQDAMRMPRVAELSGCARSLVYRYFPRREDLFAAILSEFYERLEQQLDPREQAAGMRALGNARGSAHEARPLLEAIWDAVAELGSAGLILHASHRLGDALQERLAEVSARFEDRWVKPLRESGLGEIEANLVVRSAMALQAELLDRHRQHELTREQAIDLGERALSALVAGLRTPSGGGDR